ncbi:MAG: SEC-C domain-containing protein [Fibrobacteria bacterium]|nr:SEC-C domain-containing protein [Fibrobacteria bacterium]
MTDRNDVCHCGSGRKYKKCCLEKDRAEPASLFENQSSPGTDWGLPALIGLLERFAPDEFFRAHDRLVTPDCMPFLQDLARKDQDLLQDIQSVITEAAIAQMARTGWGRKLASRLSPAQHRYLEEVAAQFLRVWNVVEVFPGEGMVLEDGETGEIVRVVERSGSVGLFPLDRVASRVIRDQTQPMLTHLFRVTDGLVHAVRRGDRNVVDLSITDPKEALEVALVREFVRASVLPVGRMKVVDAASGGTLEFVRDRFAVTDESSLFRWIKSCSELDPDPKDDGNFIRFEKLPGGAVRALAHLEFRPGRTGMVLEIHSRSREAANDHRAWLKGQAGAWLRFTSRKIEDFDPFQAMNAGIEEIGLPVDPSEVMTPNFMEQMYRTHLYHDWGNKPIPVLANQTPRQHARTERGEAAVVDLVRSYQAQENRMAHEQGRKPVDLSWLLAEAGL